MALSPKVAQTVYDIGTIVSGVVGIALIWGGVSADTAQSIDLIVSGLGTLLGGTAPAATAAVRVRSQRADGTLGGNPLDQVANGLQAIVAAETTAANIHAQAVSELDRAKQVATSVLGSAPVIGPLAAQVISNAHLPL